jgi:hypothetical protein
MDLAAP